MMQLILFICLFVFLFCLFVLSNDDFILFRKNISQERIFNIAFITIGLGIFFARLMYVIFNFNSSYLNPLTFFLFPYFPGLSLFGGIVGGLSFLLLYSKMQKIPIGRILDIFALSFLFSFSFGLFFNLLLSKKINFFVDILFLIFYSVLFIIFMIIFQKERVKDGTVGIFILISFSILTIAMNLITSSFKINYYFVSNNILSVFVLMISGYLLIKQKFKRGKE